MSKTAPDVPAVNLDDAAHAEAERRYDGTTVHGDLPYSAHALELYRRAAFVSGARWAARRTKTNSHEHDWKRQQNITSKGYAMPPIDVCQSPGCDVARPEMTTEWAIWDEMWIAGNFDARDQAEEFQRVHGGTIVYRVTTAWTEVTS